MKKKSIKKLSKAGRKYLRREKALIRRRVLGTAQKRAEIQELIQHYHQ